jgi:tRNA/tmRNA/rRNA uracil-C5-methylase (TrmA/RlmC/RlmD family)
MFLFLQSPHTRCNSEQAPFELLHGESHIVETIGKFRFRLSPESFFQVNTPAAEVLYAKVSND